MRISALVITVLSCACGLPGPVAAKKIAPTDVGVCYDYSSSADVDYKNILLIKNMRSASLSIPLKLTLLKIYEDSYFVKSWESSTEFFPSVTSCPASGCSKDKRYSTKIKNVGIDKSQFYSIFLKITPENQYHFQLTETESDGYTEKLTLHCSVLNRDDKDRQRYLGLPEKKTQ